MQIGSLQPARRPRHVAAFQWIRVVLILTLAVSGAYAVSLTAEDEHSTAMSASTEVATDTAQVLDQSEQSVFAQPIPAAEAPAQEISTQMMASADPGAANLAAAQSLLTGSSLVTSPVHDETHQADTVAADAQVQQGDAAATSSAEAADTSAHEVQQASAGETQLPDAPEMTGAVSRQASRATDDEQDKGRINLNTASFKELNTIPNAGPIGRAIIRGRPYASVEDLVNRRILRRSVYERIKNQVTVQ